LKESLYSKKYSTGGQEEGMKRKYANTKDVQSVPKKFSDAVLALCNFVYCPEGQYLQCVANDYYFDVLALCNFVYCPEGQYLQRVANDHYFELSNMSLKSKYMPYIE